MRDDVTRREGDERAPERRLRLPGEAIPVLGVVFGPDCRIRLARPLVTLDADPERPDLMGGFSMN